MQRAKQIFKITFFDLVRQPNGSINIKILLYISIALLLWSSAFAGIRAALRSYSPGHLVLLRFLIASGILLFYALITKMKLPQRKDVPGIVLIGFLGVTVYHTALTYGEQTVTSGAASMLIATSPIFTAVFAGFFLNEKVEWIGWIGIGISFIGAVLVAWGEGDGVKMEPGAFLILISAFTTSIYFIFQKKYLVRYTPIQMATFTIWAGTFFMLIFLPNLIESINNASSQDTLAIVYLGIFPAAIAYIVWMYVLHSIPASNAASFLYLSPIIASLVAWFWLGEIPVSLSIIGGILSLLGVILVNKGDRI